MLLLEFPVTKTKFDGDGSSKSEHKKIQIRAKEETAKKVMTMMAFLSRATVVKTCGMTTTVTSTSSVKSYGQN